MIFTGTNIRVEINASIDVSGAVNPVIRWRRSGISGEWPAQTDGSILYYETTTEDINKAGKWEFQGVFTLNGKKFKTEISKQVILSPI